MLAMMPGLTKQLHTRCMTWNKSGRTEASRRSRWLLPNGVRLDCRSVKFTLTAERWRLRALSATADWHKSRMSADLCWVGIDVQVMTCRLTAGATASGDHCEPCAEMATTSEKGLQDTQAAATDWGRYPAVSGGGIV